MELSLQVVQDLAPDQSSLNAAKKLLKPASWPMLGVAADINIIWGQCQGSGANPYLTMADIADHGYKCTCPSRKFPCKHVLALLWLYTDMAEKFGADTPPEWVNEWLGRRRRSSTSAPTQSDGPSTGTSAKSIAAATNLDSADALSPISAEEQLKKDAARQKRAKTQKQSTQASVRAGLGELELWIQDQLTTGVSTLAKELRERSRRIAARMVDAKAAILASRLDELSARVAGLPLARQAEFLFRELGQLVLLSQAWSLNPDDPDVRRAVQSAESREQLLQEGGVTHQGQWQCVGEQILTRRDGLVSHTTWLARLNGSGPAIALLQDYYPASAGKREAGLRVGTQLTGDILFYPSRQLERGLLLNYQIVSNKLDTFPSVEDKSLTQAYLHYLSLCPWAERMPYLLGPGRIVQDTQDQFWLCSEAAPEVNVPLSNSTLPTVLPGCQLRAAFINWDGFQAELHCADTAAWGIIAC